jgi:hypothetical protein
MMLVAAQELLPAHRGAKRPRPTPDGRPSLMPNPEDVATPIDAILIAVEAIVR